MKKYESPENIIQIHENNFFLPREGKAKEGLIKYLSITAQRSLEEGRMF